MRLLREILCTLRAYVSGQVRIALILSLLYAIGFGVLRVPAWPLIALLCGFLYFIPNFGALISLFAATGTAWLGGGASGALGVLGVWVVVQGIEGFYLTPHILGEKLRLRPMVVFFALLAGGSFFGFFGLLLAVPAVAIAMVVWNFFRGAKMSAKR